ncbi:DMT family transporter [Paenibacillus sp. tmac-D7]|uniref:DMT family transporter n=1 Tax=Paenibacillus sp. tmac-D7 TaxID=2591462 RepID=UPI0011442EAA|nr:DMT family transporter [Paenibacillus sp. tmac-D7]
MIRIRTTVLYSVLLILIWGTAFSVIKIGLEYVPPILFSGIRTILGGLFLLAIALNRGGKADFRKNGKIFGISAFFNVVLFIGLQTFAVAYLTSGLAAVLIYLQPIIVGILAKYWLKESLSPLKLAGLMLGFLGVIVISMAGISNGEISVTGICMGLASACAWAIGTVYLKNVQDTVDIPWLLAAQFTFGGLVLIVAGLFFENWSAIEWTISFGVSLLYTSVIGIMVSWMLWLKLIHSGDATVASAYTFGVPLVSIAAGILYLDEKISFTLFLGSALIVVGIYLVNRRKSLKAESTT